MSRILISRLWLTTRHDGSQIIAGKFGWDGKIRIERNPDKQAEGDQTRVWKGLRLKN